jgi:ribosomal protein S18 acetylase RimI-like enzyme
MATITAVQPKANSGLRPTDLRRDLAGIAALMELCFGATMDAAGRGAINEMRLLSHAGPLIWLVGGALHGPVWNLGFVWIENGKVVGNISTQRTSASAGQWMIANVAVHPEYRRRGIARALTAAAVDLARRQGGETALLQVNHDNVGALALYAGLGFQRFGSRTEWVRHSSSPPPYAPTPGLDIRPRRREQWVEEYQLATRVCPEGLDWVQPLRPDDFRPSVGRGLARLISGKGEERWAATAGARLAGSLIMVASPGENDHFTLLLDPEFGEQAARPLLVRGLRRLGSRPWPVKLDYAPNEQMDTLHSLGFAAGRTLVWMRQRLRR